MTSLPSPLSPDEALWVTQVAAPAGLPLPDHCRWVWCQFGYDRRTSAIGRLRPLLTGAAEIVLPDALRGAVAKRQAEYLAVRAAAQAAIHDLTGAGAVPARGKDGAPCWPAGLVGSMTHTNGQAAAVVGPSAAVAGLGLDVEDCVVDRELEGLKRQIGTAAEHRLVDFLAPPMAATLIFSAKEAIYKAVSPRLGRFMGFDEAVLTAADAASATFRIHPDVAAAIGGLSEIRVRYALLPGGVATIACLKAPSEEVATR